MRFFIATFAFIACAATSCGDDNSGDKHPPDAPLATCGSGGNVLCAADEYCDFARNSCGATAEVGVCRKRPQACPLLLIAEPTCGCDGIVYSSECDALAAGSDLDAFGQCAVNANSFKCGYRQCELGGQYCRHEVSDVGSAPDAFTCRGLPAACGNPSCACLANEPCGDMCTGTYATGMTLTCPGG